MWDNETSFYFSGFNTCHLCVHFSFWKKQSIKRIVMPWQERQHPNTFLDLYFLDIWDICPVPLPKTAEPETWSVQGTEYLLNVQIPVKIVHLIANRVSFCVDPVISRWQKNLGSCYKSSTYCNLFFNGSVGWKRKKVMCDSLHSWGSHDLLLDAHWLPSSAWKWSRTERWESG